MIIRQIKKEIYQFSVVELLEIIEDSDISSIIEEAKIELKRRNLTEYNITKAKSEYEIYKQYKQKRVNASLSAGEFFLCFFMPVKFLDASDDYTQEEITKYNEYGFKKKKKQAIKARFFGILFYIFIIISLFFFFKK